MSSLYKYIRSEFAESFFRRGTIRIGTLHEYRDTERHGSIIGDGLEGILSEEELFDHLPITSSADAPDFAKGGIKVAPGGRLELHNSKIIVEENSPDYYMYCLTKEFDDQVMKEFQCDSCIEITNVDMFVSCLKRCMRHKGDFVGSFDCVYTEKVVPPGKKPDCHPAVVKEPRYANQKDVRLLWEPINKNPMPIIPNCRRLPRYCRRL